MVKVRKTYRINEDTVHEIQVIKDAYKGKAMEFSDGEIVQIAVRLLYDLRDNLQIAGLGGRSDRGE